MSKLTPELQTKIIQLLKLGVPQKYACEACGISENTFYTWMKLGLKKDEGKYHEFHESVLKSNSEAMAIKLADLEKAAQRGSVNAITWFLEHKYPDIFGNKINVEHSGKIDNTINFVIKDGETNNGDKSAKVVKRNNEEDKPVSGGSGQQQVVECRPVDHKEVL